MYHFNYRKSSNTGRGSKHVVLIEAGPRIEAGFRVIGKLAFKKRILVCDAYRCHLSEATKSELRHGYNISTAVIPGGCTKFLQAPDVCWNKLFKDKLHELYNSWIAGDEQKEYTKGRKSEGAVI